VDDHAGFRQILRSFLPGPAAEVIECGDGSEALAAYAAHQPDWTLMDVRMPGMDGFSATRAIRARFPAARVIILAEDDFEGFREEASAAGATACILKDQLGDLPIVISSLSEDPSRNRIPNSLP
jgi:CheY-like chemotaxis protein